VRGVIFFEVSIAGLEPFKLLLPAPEKIVDCYRRSFFVTA